MEEKDPIPTRRKMDSIDNEGFVLIENEDFV